MIGVLPGEGEALAQFDSVFLTQFFTGSCSVEATSAIEQDKRAHLSYRVKIVDETIERIALQKKGRVLYGQVNKAQDSLF